MKFESSYRLFLSSWVPDSFMICENPCKSVAKTPQTQKEAAVSDRGYSS
jgi:hypothetical protein